MNINIIGGTGFIGQHLIKMLEENDKINNVRVLSRCTKSYDHISSDKIDIVCGDILSPSALKELIEEGSTVINLAFLAESPQKENIYLVNNIMEACNIKNAHRLIHCSTAVVSGRTVEHLITETTQCNPYSSYEKTKLTLEKLILDTENSGFQKVILRPTAVFGQGGKNLFKLANDLCYGNRIKCYLKSCVYGNRTMNLVSVSNVASALSFLALCDKAINGETFIIANDEEEQNNYISLEKEFLKELEIEDYLMPRIVIPDFIFKLIMRLVRKSNIDPKVRYSTNKLRSIGWESTADFNVEIKKYIKWYKESYVIQR